MDMWASIELLITRILEYRIGTALLAARSPPRPAKHLQHSQESRRRKRGRRGRRAETEENWQRQRAPGMPFNAVGRFHNWVMQVFFLVNTVYLSRLFRSDIDHS